MRKGFSQGPLFAEMGRTGELVRHCHYSLAETTIFFVYYESSHNASGPFDSLTSGTELG